MYMSKDGKMCKVKLCISDLLTLIKTFKHVVYLVIFWTVQKKHANAYKPWP